jgi:lycopene beta-cyclase
MPAQLERQAGKHYLWQHFKGWTIRTGEDCFATNIATLMDFRIDQEQGPGFVYLLPLTPGRALVEYTLFSAELLQDEAYDQTLRFYLRTMFPGIAYSIEAEEKGKIPMTNHRFPSSEGRIIYLGTMAGNTKPSSGYTFSFIQAYSEQLLAAMTQSDHPFLPKPKLNRFLWYDSVLLRVLAEGNLPAETIFRRLFTKNNPQSVLRFLNNSSSLIEELRLISSLPVLPFLSAAVKECTNSTKQVSQP